MTSTKYERRVITGDAAKQLHRACVRIVIIDREGESWTRYAIFDRRVVCRMIRMAIGNRRVLTHKPSQLADIATVPWAEYYSGPGQAYAHAPFRIVRHLACQGEQYGAGPAIRSKRWIVWQQFGGLDI